MIINFFIVIMVIGGPASGVANPKFWGGKWIAGNQSQNQTNIAININQLPTLPNIAI